MVVMKRNGKIRICLDPSDLNKKKNTRRNSSRDLRLQILHTIGLRKGILADTKLESIRNVCVAMDDILIHSNSLAADLKETTDTVKAINKSSGMKLNEAKCQYEKTKVKFLGHILSNKGLEADHQQSGSNKSLHTHSRTRNSCKDSWEW